MKQVKKILVVLLILLAVLGGAIWIFAGQLTKALNEEIEIGQVDLNLIENGAYKESYFYNEGMGATVVVTVMDHRIETIVIQEHKSGLGKKAEAIVDRVLEEQSLQVDAISGATGSSKVILKAIENALK